MGRGCDVEELTGEPEGAGISEQLLSKCSWEEPRPGHAKAKLTALSRNCPAGAAC